VSWKNTLTRSDRRISAQSRTADLEERGNEMGSEQFTRNKQYFVDRVSREMESDLAEARVAAARPNNR
jgi:hypothetical protein